ncbi:hypothetical protein JM658_16310 [Joostella atrarenae]|uniref:Uncharacterized protein n=1 Tax=Joostella atrarenae TaxID=679257 RepID=A0ABS9J7I8_9FLAO|nr:hypothetical protein [Joostella atrarenae]MCF8716395.1 hypothetical protein [Joostella atrarenae]
MLKSKISYIILSISLGAFIPILLWIQIKNTSVKSYDFKREFETTTLIPIDTISLPYSEYYLAGYSKTSLFLGHRRAVGHLLKVQLNTRKTFSISLNNRIPYNDKVRFNPKALKSTFYDNRIFLSDGFHKTLLYTYLDSINTPLNEIPVALTFTKYTPISADTFIFEVFDDSLNQNVLMKYSSNGQGAYPVKYIPKKQIDGIFCTNGILLYNKTYQKLIHIFLYRNQVVLRDTTLNPFITTKTIDPIEKTDMVVSFLNDGKKHVLKNQPTKVNKHATTSGAYYYIHSAVKSISESNAIFSSHSVIDQYNITNGTYIKSFYIPHYNNEAFRYFQVIGDSIYTLYDKKLLIYKIKASAKPYHKHAETLKN